MPNKIVVIGWDAADWQIINPLIKKGAMPALKRLIDNGTKGNIATLNPPLSPILWTSIATGKRAYDHGITGFTEVDNSGNIRAVRGSSRKVKAFWNILNEHQLKTNIIAWWPSHPAEELNGCMVSNFFQTSPKPKDSVWPLRKNSIYPESLFDKLANLRLHPEEITSEILAPFFPNASELVSDNDEVLRSIVKILSQTSSVHNAATYLIEETEWDCTAIYYDAIDHFSHLAMKYHPPKLEGIADTDFRNYHFIIEAAYRFHDMMLERIMDLCGDINYMLVSDHGFNNDQNRLLELPKTPAAPALEHRPYGVFIASGPDFKSNTTVYGSSLLDVCPTLLHLYNIPIGRDMEGKVIMEALNNNRTMNFIDSHENGQKETSTLFDGFDNEVLSQLANIGYLDTEHITKKESKKVIAENEFYLAKSYADGGYLRSAIQTMHQLLEENKGVYRYVTFQLGLLLQVGEFEKFEKLLIESKKLGAESNTMSFYWGQYHLAKGNYLKALNAFNSINTTNTTLQFLIGRTYYQKGEIATSLNTLENLLQNEPNHFEGNILKAIILFEKKRFEDSLDILLSSLNQIYWDFKTHLYIGKNLLALQEFSQAEKAFKQALQIDPKNQSALLNLKRCLEVLGHDLPANLMPHPKELVIVTGLPRSGTSMLMLMLQNGGLNLYTDNYRQPDKHNPQGYFEFKELTNLNSYSNLFAKHEQKVFKITFPLITKLPAQFNYKIIAIERDTLETIDSQNKMIGLDSDGLSFEKMIELEKMKTHCLDWIDKQINTELLVLQHQDVLHNTDSVTNKIASFLNVNLNKEKMKAAIDTSLYRSKRI